MGSRTIPIGDLASWVKIGPDCSLSEGALNRICELITRDTNIQRGSKSPLPEILLSSCLLSGAEFGGAKTNYNGRLEAVNRNLAQAYMTIQDVADISATAGKRLYALSKFGVDNKIEVVATLPPIYLESETDFRASLPRVELVQINGRLLALSLHYQGGNRIAKEGNILNLAGQMLLGGISIALEKGGARDRYGDPIVIPDDLTDIVVLDVSHLRLMDDATPYYVSAMKPLFVEGYRRTVSDALRQLSLLYESACDKLGIDPIRRLRERAAIPRRSQLPRFDLPKKKRA